MEKRRMYAVLLSIAGLLALVNQGEGQKLEDLVDENQREEEELRRIPGADTPDLLPEGMESQVLLPGDKDVQRLRIAQDRQIDPTTYIVGPGDALQLYVWGEFDQDLRFEVNPEGQALVPTIGAFDLAGRTLADAKQLIIDAAREKYPGVDITLTLQSMRFFTAYVTGAVLNGDGAIIISPVTRVSDIIDLAGGFLDDAQPAEVAAADVLSQLASRPAARRSIQIFHQDGTTEVADLAMFVATGEIKHNPYVRMGDVVHVGFRRSEVFVYGAVNLEGVQEYRPDDTIGTLIRLARGIAGSAPLAHVEIWRFKPGTDSTVVIPVLTQMPGEPFRSLDIQQVLDTRLQPKDMLFLRTRSDWQKTPTVHALGQFRFVGRYRILPGQTRLHDFIAQAGGLTDRANLLEARVIRPKFRAIEDPELQRLEAVVDVGGLADLSPEERAYLKTKQREEKGRLAVDFERLLAGDVTQDILLQGGDVVFVPEKRGTISLSGQFRRPGLVDYEPGRRAGYYLQKAGGFSFDADKGGTRLIRARTGQREKFHTSLMVEPGDEIWIPEKERRDWWALLQSTMRTTAEALTLVLVLRAI